MKRYLMAIDSGTTSCRCILFDVSGRICSVAQKEFEQIYPASGWVEHDPSMIWDTQFFACKEAMRMLGATAEEIISIGITNQRETTILWDRETGEPVYNAIVWQCRRTAERCEALHRDGYDDLIRERTGLVPDAYFSATKIDWILDHVPGARERAHAGDLLFGTVDSWLIWKLSGGRAHVTDPSNASRTMLYNIREKKWDEELLALFGIPACILPDVRPSSGYVCDTERELFGGSIPIMGIAGDQQSALFGQTCFYPGDVKNTYGTGAFLLMNTGEEPVFSSHGLITTVAWEAEGKTEYALEGSAFVAGAAVQWLRDELKLVRSARDTETEAMKVRDSGGCYVVPAFTGLGAPYWDPYARGAILGLTRGTTAQHIIRATLESIAFQVNDVLRSMAADSGGVLSILQVDGGASANRLLLQMQADISGVDVVRPVCLETTAWGAASLAGLASGVWKNREELRSCRSIDSVFKSEWTDVQRELKLRGWRKAVSCAEGWLSEKD